MYDGQGNPVTDYDPAKGRLEMQKRIHHTRPWKPWRSKGTGKP